MSSEATSNAWLFKMIVDTTRVEAQDGGDPKNEVSPRDIVYTEPAEGGFPQVIAETDLRFQYICSTLIYNTFSITPQHPLHCIVILLIKQHRNVQVVKLSHIV